MSAPASENEGKDLTAQGESANIGESAPTPAESADVRHEVAESMAGSFTGEVEGEEGEQRAISGEEEIDDMLEMEDHSEELDIPLTDLDSYLQALDLNVELPTIDLTNQGIGDEGVHQLLQKLKETNKLGAVTTMKLDGNDIEAEGAVELAEVLATNNSITFVDLKWNMIGTEGARAIGKALESNSTLESLNLDGNDLGEDGAEQLALSLVRNIGLKYLELKDNMVGNAGARALANGLSGKRDLVLLDLTSNEIAEDGAIAIAKHLIGPMGDESEDEVTRLKAECCYTLETLILNNNPLGDGGGIALGKSLSSNSHLRSLQLRNSCIGPAGCRSLADVLSTKNTVLAELDLNLNPCGVMGEISLNDMVMTRPELYVEWKDPTCESQWTINEIIEIIKHYGVSEILANILRGFSLAPLIENYKLLGALEIEDDETANGFMSEALQDEFLSSGLDMLVTMLNQGEDGDFDDHGGGTPACIDELPNKVEELPPLLKAIHSTLDKVEQRLHVNPPDMDTPGGRIVPVGEIRIKIVTFLTALVRSNAKAINDKLIELQVPQKLWTLMESYSLNNFLHEAIAAFFRAVFRCQNFRQRVLSEGGMLNSIMVTSKREWTRGQGERAGYSGHLAQIVNQLVLFENEESVKKIFDETEGWQYFIDNDLPVYNDENSTTDPETMMMT